jgi:ribose 5-phosphate isomerase B
MTHGHAASGSPDPRGGQASLGAIAVGSDDAGAALRHVIIEHLRCQGLAVDDYGTDQPDPAYPVIAEQVARRVAGGEYGRAILICGTGIGVSIVANKVPGVYAALAHDVFSARRARLSNNAQILALGARVIGAGPAREIVDAWMAEEFHGGPSADKLALIADLEARVAGPSGQ